MFKSSKIDSERMKYARKHLIKPIIMKIVNRRELIDTLDISDFVIFF